MGLGVLRPGQRSCDTSVAVCVTPGVFSGSAVSVGSNVSDGRGVLVGLGISVGSAGCVGDGVGMGVSLGSLSRGVVAVADGLSGPGGCSTASPWTVRHRRVRLVHSSRLRQAWPVGDHRPHLARPFSRFECLNSRHHST